MKTYCAADLFQNNFDFANIAFDESYKNELYASCKDVIEEVFVNEIKKHNNLIKDHSYQAHVYIDSLNICHAFSPFSIAIELLIYVLHKDNLSEDLKIRLALNPGACNELTQMLLSLSKEIAKWSQTYLKKFIDENEKKYFLNTKDLPENIQKTFESIKVYNRLASESQDLDQYFVKVVKELINQNIEVYESESFSKFESSWKYLALINFAFNFVFSYFRENPRVLKIVGDRIDDLRNPYLRIAFQSDHLSIPKKIKIILSNIRDDHSKEDKKEIFSILFLNLLYHLNDDQIRRFFEYGKKFMTPQDKVYCYSRLGAMNYIDSILKDKTCLVREFGFSLLDSSDKRILEYIKNESSKLLLRKAVLKMDISFLPFLLGTKVLKDREAKKIWDKRMLNKF